jgi:hypothetical protein
MPWQRALYSYRLAAANMTRKLDASSALAEYEMVTKMIDEQRATNDHAYEDLHAKCTKAMYEANEIIREQVQHHITSPNLTRERDHSRAGPTSHHIT